MTIPRTLLALSILVLGLMIWGVHHDIYGVKEVLTAQGTTVTERIDAMKDYVKPPPPVVVTKTKTKVRYKTKIKYLKPSVVRPKKPAAKAHSFRWNKLLLVKPLPPEQEIESIPPRP